MQREFLFLLSSKNVRSFFLLSNSGKISNWRNFKNVSKKDAMLETTRTIHTIERFSDLSFRMI